MWAVPPNWAWRLGFGGIFSALPTPKSRFHRHHCSSTTPKDFTSVSDHPGGENEFSDTILIFQGTVRSFPRPQDIILLFESSRPLKISCQPTRGASASARTWHHQLIPAGPKRRHQPASFAILSRSRHKADSCSLLYGVYQPSFPPRYQPGIDGRDRWLAIQTAGAVTYQGNKGKLGCVKPT